jgi:hypothetical protein
MMSYLGGDLQFKAFCISEAIKRMMQNWHVSAYNTTVKKTKQLHSVMHLRKSTNPPCKLEKGHKKHQGTA